MLDRRQFLAASASATALTAVPGHAAAPGTDGDAAAEALLARIAYEILVDHPENASTLGLDKGARAGLKARLSDRSLAGKAREAAEVAARLRLLRSLPRGRLSDAARLDLDVAETAHRTAAEGFRFPYGEIATLNANWSYRNSPYALAQNFGAFVETPDLLDSNHTIDTPADVEAYYERMRAYALQLDGETERLRHDAAVGVVLPDFLLDKTIRQMKAARSQPVSQWGLVTSLVRRFAARNEDIAGRAVRIAEAQVAPSLDRQLAELARQRVRADARAGCWKLPQGEAFYAWCLRAGTTTTRTPDEVHRMGLEELAALQARMEPILRSLGLTQGSVGARMTALGKDPKSLFPNTDAGRKQILDYLNGRVADIRTRLPRAFATLVRGNLVIKRVPPDIEAGAPGGYAAAGTIDGSVPGNYYINLRDTSIWPRHALPTLTYHEGIPGHVWQGEYTYRLPLIRSLLAFNAYSEGWALYAEQLADELGVYDGDPVGRLGYLQSLAFRACRLVVDTGIHAKRWTRERAIQWFVDTNGSSYEEVQGEVDRYCAWPGQACGYKVGHSEINRLRDKAKASLGAKFDLRTFDDALVLGGNVPLTLLERVIDRYIAERRA
jgi:uncharacterized protein (DUF885 family)